MFTSDASVIESIVANSSFDSRAIANLIGGTLLNTK